MPSLPIHRPSIPIAYLQLLIELLAERGLLAERLLAQQPIAPDLLDQPQARMSEFQWAHLVLRALELTGDPGLGYDYGLRMRPTSHGVLGYAALSCATLRDAMELSVRYFRLRQARFTLRYTEDGGWGRLELIEREPIPVARSFFIENILLGLARSTAVLLGRELLDLQELEIWFDWSQPAHFPVWQARLPPIRFERPANALCLPLEYLNRRLVLADPLASRQAIDICERELALAAGQEADITARVRAELTIAADGGYPGLDTVAAHLHLSGRSLKRKLQQQGASFQLLLEETRRRDAQQLLEHSALSIQAIASRLGYRNPANFSRAFQRWIGCAPRDWRDQRLRRPGDAGSE